MTAYSWAVHVEVLFKLMYVKVRAWEYSDKIGKYPG